MITNLFKFYGHQLVTTLNVSLGLCRMWHTVRLRYCEAKSELPLYKNGSHILLTKCSGI
jgi:hypothetical protein